jgi:hypothetical protein
MKLAWAFYDSTGALLRGILGSWKFHDATGTVIGGGGSGSGLSQANVLKIADLRA